MSRSSTVSIKVSPDERRSIDRAARAAGVTISSYCARVLVGAATPGAAPGAAPTDAEIRAILRAHRSAP